MDKNRTDFVAEATLFKASDVERITGLSGMMQRDWRQRGFIKKVEGHGRYDAFEVAEILIMKKFADRGLGPAVSQNCAPVASQVLVAVAMSIWTDEYEDGGLTAVTGYAALAQYLGYGAFDQWSFKQSLENGEEIALAICRKLGRDGNFHPHRFMVWAADDQIFFYQSVDDLLHEEDSADARYGVMFVLDLLELAELLVRTAGVPLVRVSIASGAT